MSDERILVDAGPLVAILNVRDSSHQVCCDFLHECRLPLITTWPVVAEAAWLLRSVPNGVSQLLGMIETGVVECLDLSAAAAEWIRVEMERYADLQSQLADVSLLYLAQQMGLNDVFTLDRRDFLVYRNSRGQGFVLHPVIQ